MAYDWLQYANQGATRNQPLDPDLIRRLQFLEDMGITAKVISGGQDATGPHRTGSHRHDHGGSGDMDFYKDGRKLSWNNPDDLPTFKDIVRRAKAAGITGIGAGDDYMGPGRMHIGMGSPAVWGAEGKGANAPAWLREAYGAPAPSPAASAIHPEIDPTPAAAPNGMGMTLGSNFGQGMGQGMTGASVNAAAAMQGLSPWNSIFGGLGKMASGMGKKKQSSGIIPTTGLQDDPGRMAAAAQLMAIIMRNKQQGLIPGLTLGT